MKALLIIAVLAGSTNALAAATCHKNQMALTSSYGKLVAAGQSTNIQSVDVQKSGPQKPAEVGR